MPLKVVAMVLAGGKGERLYPLTRDRAKPAVPFGGIYRIIDFTLSNCINSGIRQLNLLTQYKSLSLNRHIMEGWNIFSSELNEYINLIPAQQRVGEDWYLGTADAIYQNVYVLQMDRPDLVVILSGDHIYKMNYREMIDTHLARKADLTAGVIEMDKALSPNFGVLEVDENYRIVGFEEKPRIPRTIPGHPDLILANMGVYVFNTEVLVRRVIEDAKDPASDHDFGRNVIPAMVGQDRVFAYSFRDENKKTPKYWRDIGTLDAYYQASMDLVDIDPQFNLYDQDWPIRTYSPPTPPAKTVFFEKERGRVGCAFNSLISGACIISGGTVLHSILSPRVRIHSYAEVRDSILMDGVDVGRHARLNRTIIDKWIQIPEGYQIGANLEEDAKKFTVTDSGIVVIPKGTILA
ncbi:MAG: glucose-1-phosphate adenylyltransferase [Deltaproteobacteria bacterium]|nr:glucose-1-phosphate adenylyltransferase [Deltaproteobacteria bacterium]